ncbi:MAG: hypothetical protein M0R80_13660 [Proteobacteria bacterium]|jgi:hypothetical protein|nr:hypothetical protein [Pseudomonadota bacterium]
MTKSDLSKLFAFVTALYPNITVKAGTLEAWFEMIGDLPADLAKAAFMKALAQQEIPCLPAVGKIREAALSLSGNKAPTALEAWGQVREAIRRDKPASTLHPAIQKAILAFGGLDGIGYSENITYIEGRFLKEYNPLMVEENNQAVLPEAVRAFIGSAEVKRIGA